MQQDRLYYGGKDFTTFTERLLAANLILVWTISGSESSRALWIVFTQQSVFKTRPSFLFSRADFHGFVFYFLVNLVDVFEGFVSFHARGGAFGAVQLIGGPIDREAF